MTIERRAQLTEVRVEGRRLTGVALRYGDTSPSHRERFEAGALRYAGAVPLNLEHDPFRAIAWQPDGGLTLENTAGELRLVAVLPPIPAADAALVMVENREATGLSIEFRAEAERQEDGLRIIERAELRGIALVRSPSYPQSRVEARGAGRRIPIWL